MTGYQLFEGFRVAAGADRFGERVTRGGEPNDCKLSARDTEGALCIFEFTGRGGWPTHWHREQDEWLYVVAGEVGCEVGAVRHRLRAGESIFVPRQVAHAWAARGGADARVLEVYQPAGRMEQFLSMFGRYSDRPLHEALSIEEMVQLFDRHAMHLVGPGLGWDE